MLARLEFQMGLVAVVLLACADIFGLPASITAAHLSIILFLPFWLNSYLARQRRPLDYVTQLSVAMVLIGAGSLLAMSVVSAIYSPEPLRVGRSGIAMLSALAMFFFVFGTFTERRAWTALNVLVAAAAFVCVLTLLGWVSPEIRSIVYEADHYRARGTFKNQNQFGIMLSCVMPAAAAMIFVNRGLLRLWSVFALVLLCTGLALSGSKTNLVIAFFGLTLFFFVIAANTPNPRTRVIRFVAVLTVIVLCSSVVGATLYFFNPRTIALAVEYWNAGTEARTIVSRQEIWRVSLNIFEANPFFGGGAGSGWIRNWNYSDLSHSHNALLEYARLLGATGMALIFLIHVFVVFLCGETFFRCVFGRGATEDKAILLALAIGALSFIAANQMSDSFGATTAPFFWLVFFALAYHRSLFVARPRNDLASVRQAPV